MKRDTALLPRFEDRYQIGDLSVSPICIGSSGSPEVITSAYESGVNFFFLSADLHWPQYDHTRIGLMRLLKDNPGRRREIIVAGASYIEDPLYSHGSQFADLVASIPGLKFLDILVPGAISTESSVHRIGERLNNQMHARALRAGAFHGNTFAFQAFEKNLIDIGFVRYNTAYIRPEKELFDKLSDRMSLLYTFKSLMYRVPENIFQSIRLPEAEWLPKMTDYYRFALTHPCVEGVLCSPPSRNAVRELRDTLSQPPLTHAERSYMIWLSLQAVPLLANESGQVRA